VRDNQEMMFMSQFCKFQKLNRELSYASSAGASRSYHTKLDKRGVSISSSNLSVTINSQM
jgi:hypothetical protein